MSDRRCEHCKATKSLAIDPMLMGHVDFTCHHNYPAQMPPIVHHSCPDCLALAKVLRDQLKELGELGNNQSIFGRMWNLGCDLDAFLKEREK